MKEKFHLKNRIMENSEDYIDYLVRENIELREERYKILKMNIFQFLKYKKIHNKIVNKKL